MSSTIHHHPAIVQVIPEFAPTRHRPARRSAPITTGTGPVVPARATPPAQVQWVLRLILEVVLGRRPISQLAGLINRSVQRYVSAEIHRTGRQRTVRPRPAAGRGTGATSRGELRGMRLCQPADGVAEVSAVWRHQGRYRALAARFEYRQPRNAPPRWVCTVLRLG